MVSMRKGQVLCTFEKIDKLVEFAKGYGAKGLAYIAIGEDGTVKSSFAKFMKEEEMSALIAAMDGQNGDLLLFAADKTKLVWDVLVHFVWSLQNRWNFWIRMNTALYGLQNSRFWSGQRRSSVLLPCIIPLPCPWRRIWNISILRSGPCACKSIRYCTQW